MSRYQLLTLDIDGTALSSAGTLSPRLKAAVAKAQHAGMRVTLATGRNLRATLPVADALEICTPLIISNGALVIDPISGQTLLHRPLDRTVAVQTVQHLQRMGFTVYANRFALEGPDLFYEQEPPLPEQACLLGREPGHVRKVFDLAGAVASLNPLKVMTIDRTDAIERAAERLRRHLTGNFHVLVTPEGPGFSLLEVGPAGVTKATGLDRLAALNGIRPAEIIAFGDNFNDVEMLQYAGMGVAMGNAPEAVKQVAAAVTGTNDEDGVAAFLEQYAIQAA